MENQKNFDEAAEREAYEGWKQQERIQRGEKGDAWLAAHPFLAWLAAKKDAAEDPLKKSLLAVLWKHEISIESLIKDQAREIKMREIVYSKRVVQGKMSVNDSMNQMNCAMAILELLKALREPLSRQKTLFTTGIDPS